MIRKIKIYENLFTNNKRKMSFLNTRTRERQAEQWMKKDLLPGTSWWDLRTQETKGAPESFQRENGPHTSPSPEPHWQLWGSKMPLKSWRRMTSHLKFYIRINHQSCECSMKHVSNVAILKTLISFTFFLRKLLKDTLHQNKGATSQVFLRRMKSWEQR